MPVDRIEMAIVGAGAVGCAIACELLRRGRRDVFLFERSDYLADGQSGRNSGVIHAGLYYAPGSLKARLCVEGNALLYAFCEEHGVPFARTGKLVVATDAAEERQIEALFENARRSGARDVRLVDAKEIRRLEPNVVARMALTSPSTGSVDAASYVQALARLAERRGAQLLMQAEVVAIEPRNDGCALEVARRDGRRECIEADCLINASGLSSDRLARMVDPAWPHDLVPLRGEYFTFNRAKREGLRMNGLNIYPVQETVRAGGADVAVVGTHLTPTFGLLRDDSIGIGDIVTVGPEFAEARDREDLESNRMPREVFHRKAVRFFPNLEENDLEIGFTGIMASRRGGGDWIIARDGRHSHCLQLVGLDSPALTSSLAIARHVAEML